MTNRYLEKIALAMSVKEYTDNLNNESEAMLNELGADLIRVDRKTSPDLYDLAMSSGGHGTKWSIRERPEGGLVESFKVLHTRPDWRVRLGSPLYSIFQSKDDANLMSAVNLRHETLETSELKNRLMPLVHKAYKENTKIDWPGNVVVADEKGRILGEHANLAVIMQESNIVHASPYKDRLSRLFKVRNKYESQFLKELTGKDYGDYFTEEDLAKGRHY